MSCACKEIKHFNKEKREEFKEMVEENGVLMTILKQFFYMIGSIFSRILMCAIVAILIVVVGISIIISSLVFGKPMIFIPKLDNLLKKQLHGENSEIKD